MIKSATRMLLPKTLEEVWYRGEQYFRENRVEVIKSDEKEIGAFVSGTEKYLVNLKFSGGGISKHCSCPYAKDSLAHHPACKHMVAVGILWDEKRGIAKPTKEEINSETIEPALISQGDINDMFNNPVKADLEKLRILADETALGGRPRPHARLPNMPKMDADLDHPLSVEEVMKSFREIKGWTNRYNYDLYFCSGEMVAALCEVLRIIKKRLFATPPLIGAKILREAQRFHYQLIMELIDDSNGLHEFTEAHLEDIYNKLKAEKVGKEQETDFTQELEEFEDHRNDY